MRPHPSIPLDDRSAQRGFSIVELLVALAVSLFILAGVITAFASNKHAFRVLDASNVLQENGRFAVAQLTHSVRMAGHLGGVEASEVSLDGGLAVTGLGNCSAAWIADVDTALRGYDGAASIAALATAEGFPTGCIPSTDYLPGTDILVARYAEPVKAIPQPSVMLRAAIGTRALLGNAPAAGALPTFGLPAQDGTLDYGYRIEVWFIRPCSDPSGGTSATACDSGDDDGEPIPTLARLALQGTQLAQQAMYEGIEQLQLEYGRDTDGDKMVDRLDTASTLNASGDPAQAWSQVTSVQVALLSRSGQRDATFVGEQQFSMAGDTGAGTTGFTVPSASKYYLRKSYQVTAQVRSRVR